MLALWEPVAFAATAGALPSLAARGPLAIVEFIWAAAAASVSVAAAWALVTQAPAAVPLARASIIATAARELQRLIWTGLPSDVVPGTRIWIAAGVVIGAAALWISTARVDVGRA